MNGKKAKLLRKVGLTGKNNRKEFNKLTAQEKEQFTQIAIAELERASQRTEDVSQIQTV